MSIHWASLPQVLILPELNIEKPVSILFSSKNVSRKGAKKTYCLLATNQVPTFCECDTPHQQRSSQFHFQSQFFLGAPISSAQPVTSNFG